MDRHFLELWGNLLLNAAQGQKRLEDFVGLMGGDPAALDDFQDLFAAFYGLDIFTKDTPGYLELWKKAAGDFHTSFKEFLSLMDLVTRQDYEALLRENEELREKLSGQEEVLHKLGGVFDTRLAAQGEGLEVFESLIQDQTRQFQDLLSSFTNLLGEKPAGQAAEAEKPRPAKKKAAKKPAANQKKKSASGRKPSSKMLR